METVTKPEAGAKVDAEASGIVGGREVEVVPAQICHQNVNEMEEEKMVLFWYTAKQNNSSIMHTWPDLNGPYRTGDRIRWTSTAAQWVALMNLR